MVYIDSHSLVLQNVLWLFPLKVISNVPSGMYYRSRAFFIFSLSPISVIDPESRGASPQRSFHYTEILDFQKFSSV